MFGESDATRGDSSAEPAHHPAIGFVGLGTMGGPMCARLIEAGYQVTAYDVDDDALSRMVGLGAEAAESTRDCAQHADLLMTSLPTPRHVEAVMCGSDGALRAMRPGSIWVDLTTNSLDLLRHLAAGAPDGVAVVDSPVTGAVDGARRGTLTLFAGGDRDSVDRILAPLSHLGTVIPCGPLGSGTVVKLVTNQLWFAAAAALGEGFAVGLANGVDLRTLWEAILAGVADSFVARHDAPSIFAGHWDPSFPLDLCLKDLGLLAGLESNVDTDLPVTAAARSAFERAADRYGPRAGEMCVARRIAEDAGLSMRVEGHWVPHWEA